MNLFEIKEFYGEETLKYKKLCTKLFRFSNPDLLNEEEYSKKLIDDDNNRDKDFVRLGAFYNGILYAGIEMIPYDVNINGKVCKMYGIGGVISDPECPQKGAVKELFKKGFEIMREKGVYISHLYPFEVNYYRQYGYDMSCEHSKWYVPIKAITSFKDGELRHFDNSDKMKKDIIDIYNTFSKNKNMSIVRTEKQWNDFFESHKSYTTNYFSYVHYTDGIADGYMCYVTKENADRPMDLETERFWFTSFEGLRGLISYFPTQKSYADNAIIKLPADIDISALIDSCGGWGKKNASKVSFTDGTSKVVDVEKILLNSEYYNSGKVTIKINDTYCPWNNDCFTLEFGNNTIVTRGGIPDIEMDIKSFTSSILGRYDFDSCKIFPDIKVYGNEENLKKVFFPKSCFIEEHF